MKFQQKKPKVMFFANIPIEGVEMSTGGATVLSAEILKHLKSSEKIVVNQVQIRNIWKFKLQLFEYFIWIFRFPFIIRKFDVISFHASIDFHFTIAPILWLWAKFFRKKIVYHFFGGNFNQKYERLPYFFKKLFDNTILNSDTVFFETKILINYFQNLNKNNIVWLPNSRKAKTLKTSNKKFSRRFVFISRVIPQKGIEEIIKVSEQLPHDYCIDVYGPIDNREYKSDYFNNKKVNYIKSLNPEEVLGILSQYDVKLLPTYFKSEGYPGILIECLSLGIPVITTNWRSIPEIITDNYNGKIIPIKDTEALKDAILSFSEENYSEYSKNAINSFQDFNSDIVFNKFIDAYLR